MNRRFFSEKTIEGESIQLSAAESQHVAKVLRAQVGDEITVFDGSGVEFLARIVAVERPGVQLRLIERLESSREAHRVLVLGAALPKGDRQRWLIEKCVELGVHQVVPLRTARGVAVSKPSVIDRLERSVIEASKQCGRNRLMQIGPPCRLAAFVSAAPKASVRWLAHPHASQSPRHDTTDAVELREQVAVDQPVYVAIGPEGGFDEAEVEVAIAAGWTPVRLAQSLLRVETAAIAAVAYWLVEPQ